MTDRLLLDAMCGKLAAYLRMCGYDAAYALDGAERGPGRTAAEPRRERDPTDDDLLARAAAEGRRLVTRDRDLAGRAPDAVLLESPDVGDQLRELADAGFELTLPEEPTRCGACNGPLEPVDRTEPTPEYAPTPGETDVWRCVDCGQHFWRGSHWDDVAARLATL